MLFMKENKVTFAAGCFWGTEAIFRGSRGIIETTVGYMGGHYKNPTYEDVLTDATGHAEVAQIIYDEDTISFETLLRMLFKSHNPTILPSIKYKYRSSIFYYNDEQKKTAEIFLDHLQHAKRYTKSISTSIVPASTYYLAEPRHQHYYEKNNRIPKRIRK